MPDSSFIARDAIPLFSSFIASGLNPDIGARQRREWRLCAQLLVLLRDDIPAQALVLALSLELGFVSSLLRSVRQSRIRIAYRLFELGLTLHLSLRERFGSRVANLRGVLGVSALCEDDFRVLSPRCAKMIFECLQILPRNAVNGASNLMLLIVKIWFCDLPHGLFPSAKFGGFLVSTIHGRSG